MNKTILTLFCAVWIACFQTTHQLEIVYAVNCGGHGYTDSNGIDYIKDPIIGGEVGGFGQEMRDVSYQDRPLYQTNRFSGDRFDYKVPVNGDGCYGLLLHFADDSSPTLHERRQTVMLNSQHTLLSNFNFLQDCGRYIVCNRIFYFRVKGDTVYYGNQKSSLDNGHIVLNFKSLNINAVINGILLVKGYQGEGKSIVGTRTVFYFDEHNSPGCVKQQTECKECPICPNVPTTVNHYFASQYTDLSKKKLLTSAES